MDLLTNLPSNNVIGVVIASVLFLVFVLRPYIVDWWSADDIVRGIAKKQKREKAKTNSDDDDDEDLQALLDKQLSAIEKMQKHRKMLTEEQKKLKEAKSQSHVLGRDRTSASDMEVAKPEPVPTSASKTTTASIPAPNEAARNTSRSPDVKPMSPAVLAAMAELDAIAKHKAENPDSGGTSSAAGALGALEAEALASHNDGAIRANQDAAYEESLKADLLRNALEEAQQVAEKEKALIRRQQELQETADRIDAGEKDPNDADTIRDAKFENMYGAVPEEPVATGPDVITIQFQIKRTKQMVLKLQLQNSSAKIRDTVKVVRKFHKTEQLRGVLAFLRRSDCKADVADEVEILVPYPKSVVFTTEEESNSAPSDMSHRLSQTLEDLQIQNNSVLMVHSL